MRAHILYIILIGPLTLFASCRSVKYIPVSSSSEIRDSVVIRDSIVTREEIHSRDSIITKDSTVIVIDDQGKVIRTELYRQKEIYSDLQAKYTDLQERFNRLKSEKVDTIREPYPVYLDPTFKQKLEICFWPVAILSIIIIILIYIILRKVRV